MLAQCFDGSGCRVTSTTSFAEPPYMCIGRRSTKVLTVATPLEPTASTGWVLDLDYWNISFFSIFICCFSPETQDSEQITKHQRCKYQRIQSLSILTQVCQTFSLWSGSGLSPWRAEMQPTNLLLCPLSFYPAPALLQLQIPPITFPLDSSCSCQFQPLGAQKSLSRAEQKALCFPAFHKSEAAFPAFHKFLSTWFWLSQREGNWHPKALLRQTIT